MQTETAKSSKMTAVPKRQKLTVTKLDIAKQPKGYSFQGKYIGLTQSQPFNQVDQKTGEVVQKTLTQAVFESLENTDRFSVIVDAGLRTALTDAMVKEGQKIEIVKLDKIALKGGRSMNQYDIYALA